MPPKYLAEAPFNDRRADLILQSSDNVHFRVSKLILSLASPILSDMFTIPQPRHPRNLRDEVQVVHLTEHSTALDVVLCHIYPMPSPEGDTLYHASILAEFARKYQVEALVKFIKLYLTDGVKRDPVGVYAIAVSYGYSDIGAIAAWACLNIPFSGLESPYLQCTAANHLWELYRYHAACGEAAAAVAASNRTWFLSLDQHHDTSGIACFACSVPDVLDLTSIMSTVFPGPSFAWNGRTSPRCMWNYLHRSALALAHHPSAEAVTAEDFVLKSSGCNRCPQSIRVYLLELSVVLGREIKKAIEQVPLPKAVSIEPSGAATATD